MAVYGYARVSTEDQELGLQVSALTDAGVATCDIVQEKASGGGRRRTAGRMLRCWPSYATATSWSCGKSIASAARPSTR